MKTASQFMLEKVSYRGGFVWSYLPDFSRQWGELEARRSMIWMQPPGTASVGHLFLDAYHATGDEFYYVAAEKVAGAIIYAQHPSGGWNYVADFAGETALKEWYATIGKNAWRLEEFQHYYGNATFDDVGTAEAAKFLLRLYSEKRDSKYRPALDKAIHFMLASQYPIGGWPQRFPLMYDHPYKDHADYSSFITFNDDVAAENIDFLLMCYQILGEARVREPVIRAMNSFLVTQMGQPQPGWALQYTPELVPAGARSYEPKSLHTPTTAENIQQLIKFYRMTGETKFLARIPEALAWLESLTLPIKPEYEGRSHPSFIELDTNKALFTHRRGANVSNGEYYVDYTPGNMLAHYKSASTIDLAKLRAAYEQVLRLTPKEVTVNSPLKAMTNIALPKYFTLGKVSVSDLNFRAQKIPETKNLTEQAAALIGALNQQGYWPTPLYYTTNPYKGVAPITKATNEYAATMVGDEWDTSPFPVDDPVMGISTGAYIKNMGVLIQYLQQQSAQ
ncbi:pectate lyase [Cellvibrio fibrivorans]|uniref:PelA/Pel-15E family pectate lyase n=1 Tax=Cellvibrio fibrivorans TaxID=126350 RepID=A0ABU1UVG2_9GAMM|nr:pectate lyase [Cellvibrio fibrivorans]MDR7089155.1 PelA/Pel-15E family pectate lyase [Cellvibrio fibrivorans]